MKQKSKWIPTAGLLLVLVLAACSAAPQAAAPAGAPGQANNPGGQTGFGGAALTADTPLETKLAVGLLKLEGTSLSVTPAEAKAMLPLWEQIKTDFSSATPQPEGMTSVYQDIEKTLSADQIKMLTSMSITGAEMRDLMTVLDITPNAGAFGNFGGNPTQFAEQRATRIAEGTQVPNGGFGRPNGTPGAAPDGTRFPRNGTPGAGGRGGGNRGMTLLFIDPLIKMLQTRAGG